MPSRNLKKLAILLSFVILAACAKTVPIEPLPCPEYPELLTITIEQSENTPEEVKAIVVENYLRLDEYAQRLEVRAGCNQ